MALARSRTCAPALASAAMKRPPRSASNALTGSASTGWQGHRSSNLELHARSPRRAHNARQGATASTAPSENHPRSSPTGASATACATGPQCNDARRQADVCATTAALAAMGAASATPPTWQLGTGHRARSALSGHHLVCAVLPISISTWSAHRPLPPNKAGSIEQALTAP